MNKVITVGAQCPIKPPGIYWVESPKGGERQKWRIYSPTAWGVWTHYHGQTSPCYENHKYCVHGHDPSTLRWKGYLFGWFEKKRKQAFLQITPEFWAAVEAQLGPGNTLRGKSLYAIRISHNKGPLACEMIDYMDSNPADCPKDQDPRASIYRTWKLDDPGHRWAINPHREKDLNVFSA